MKAPARDRLASLLAGVNGGGSASAQRTLPADAMRIEVHGVGPLDLPVPEAQAQQLAAVARPAKYGRGTETLFDPQVRDTWEVPKSRVRVDRAHWDRTVAPVLDRLRDDLGLPSGTRLRADFHSMLVYGPGQFFKPHLDSEKADGMVGSLVVTLPSGFRGGALVVEHADHRAAYRGSKAQLSCVAFYADCRHEIRPVTAGYRIVLTYDLVLQGAPAGAAFAPGATSEGERIEAVAGCLDEHFATAPAPRWRDDRRSAAPPSRLVYLLDHQYTQRSVSWSRLKGDDAARVALLRDAAARADCEVALALADIHETRECYDDSWEAYGGRWGGWHEDEEDDESDPGVGGDGEAVAEGELLDWDLSLGHWIDAGGGAAEPIGTRVHDDEVAASTPTSDFAAYESEYQPYMGNWGNTMDRWYRRAAVVLWPRRLDFAVRAEASPAWALGTLVADGEPVSVEERREMAAALAPFWAAVAPKEPSKDYLTALLRAAVEVDEPDLARMLLDPHLVEDLAPEHAPAVVALADRYGPTWTSALVAHWVRDSLRWSAGDGRRLTWLGSAGDVARALVGQGPTGRAMATTLVEEMWAWTERVVDKRRQATPPSARNRGLAELAGPIVGELEAVAVADDDATADAVVASLVDDVGDVDTEVLMPLLIGILREAEGRPGGPALAATLEPLVAHGRRRFEARLERRRDPDDWSVPFDGGCGCADCRTLAAFLGDPAEQRREWPLAKPRRQHIHRALDARELPVRHQTHRTGRPYVLVLTKTDALFARDAEERRRAAADLAWLDSLRI